MNELDLYKAALEKWGAQAQISVAAEELAELIQVLMKQGRKINGKDKHHLLDEMADVTIMLEQLMVVFDLSHYELNQLRTKKLARLKKLLKEA